MNEKNDAPEYWFAMSAPYRNELKAKADLEKAGLYCFVPMRWEVRMKGRTRQRVRVPVIHNLIFVRGTADQLQNFKMDRNYVQYLMRSTLAGKREKIIVPDRQMEQFIRICESDDDSLRYLEPAEVNLRKGTHVRIIGGVFDGSEGYFVRVQGVRNRRFVVTIPGLAAVSVEVTPDLIEVLEE
jgi:transcription antitermination factor NusG